MAQHSRPLPSPRTPGLVFSGPTSPTPHPEVPATTDPVAPPPAPAARPEPAAPAEPPTAATTAPTGHEGPWYRREAWLAVSLAAVVPVALALVVPPAARLVLIALGGALLLAGLVLLARQQRAPHARD